MRRDGAKATAFAPYCIAVFAFLAALRQTTQQKNKKFDLGDTFFRAFAVDAARGPT